MSGEHSSTDRRSGSTDDREIVPGVVDWLVAAFLVMGGLALTLGGTAVLWVVDEDLVADAIAEAAADGTLQADALTPAQVTDIASATVFWTGIGLVLTGLAVIVVGVIYLLARRRVRRSDGAARGRDRLFTNAVLGAVVTGIVSFVPASPVLGGGVAGYLQRKHAGGVTKAGALSGLFAGLSLVLILVFVALGLLLGFSEAGAGGLGVVVGLAILIAIVGTLVYFVGLGALGGYLADALADDERPPDEGTATTRDEESTV